ncbi:hypothetical protein PIB30_024839 [Stylosanthes scabra]|uniref:RING-type domain-containing protein n=1 Tax=Stylosanthes scabra TaxID=79078 RepID=A0ABU6Y8X9_9FABA|nr:hypothetical protein [Stylosanthes scabra]
MADHGEEGGGGLFNGNVSSVLAGMGSAVVVLLIYRCMSMFLCIRNNNPDEMNATSSEQVEVAESSSSLNNWVSHMIPSHKYEKKNDKDDDDDCICAVCLGEFEEGEELRSMPECMHSFHVPCIDMWLRSHSSCPLCRAHATPSSSSSSNNVNNNHTTIHMDFMQHILLHQAPHAPSL